MLDVPVPSIYGPSADEGSHSERRSAPAGRCWSSPAAVRPPGHRQRRRLSLRRLRPGVLHSGRRPRARPAAFPRDAALIDAQGRLMLVDEALAGWSRATGLSLERVFLAGYLLVAGARLGRPGADRHARVSRSPWATRRARRRLHAAPSDPANQRQLARAVLPPAHAGVRPRAAGGRRGAPAPARGWRSALVGVGRASCTSPRRSGSPCSSASPSLILDRRLATGSAAARGRRRWRWRRGRCDRAAARLARHDGRDMAAGGGQQGLAVRDRLAGVGVGGQSRAARAALVGRTGRRRGRGTRPPRTPRSSGARRRSWRCSS